MRLRRIEISVATTDGQYGAALDFPDGLVVVWADNSMGKSTCLKAIVVALGLESMLSAQQSDLPLPPAVKTRLSADNGEHDVLESEVFLEIENHRSDRIVVQRTIKGARDKNLVTVYFGPALTATDATYPTRDFFVNRQGAATRESGFHHFLADFLGWDLPLVSTYDGNQCPLYLQCIFPYVIVEQTRGWSSSQPPLPTHFRLRDAHKRAVEFILNLDAHRNALRRQELQFAKIDVESKWAAQIARVEELARMVGAATVGLPRHPTVAWPPRIPPNLMVSSSDQGRTLAERIQARRIALTELVEKEIPLVESIATAAQEELNIAESRVMEREAVLSRLLGLVESEGQEVARVDERLKAIQEDIQKHKDLQVLRQLGSRKDSAIDNGACPVCHQSIQDSLLPIDANQSVMSVKENIAFLVEQQKTYELMLANAKQVAVNRSLQVRALRDEMANLRGHVRSLRRTLVSDGRIPSEAAIRARVALESAIEGDEEDQEAFDVILDGFAPLAARWQQVQEAVTGFPKDDVSESDRGRIHKWTKVFREQLAAYGFRSFPVNEVHISADSYRPEHQGFEMEASLSIQNSISASDLIRTIWSYLSGLLELARTEATNHPGLMVFDEPKQQSTHDISFGSLLKRTAAAGAHGQQVIFFTSENRDRLKEGLAHLEHTLREIEGRVLKRTGG